MDGWIDGWNDASMHDDMNTLDIRMDVWKYATGCMNDRQLHG